MNIMHTKSLLLVLLTYLSYHSLYAQQKYISITIDDIPNTKNYVKDSSYPKLLNVLDSLDIPFTIFINEGKIYQTDNIDDNKAALHSWINHKKAYLGNHTYSHLRYSETNLNTFMDNVKKGEKFTKQFAQVNNKELKYFRFPFNDMGKDSIQQTQGVESLESMGYNVAPFTIESADWMFNAIYLNYMKKGLHEKASEIGNLYVKKTISLVEFFENMAIDIYGRPIPHIYLCHDNMLNAAYLNTIVQILQEKKYQIISLKKSLEDPIYNSQNHYYKKWGISWLYRWIEDDTKRMYWMKKEPQLNDIQDLYNNLN